MYGIKIENTFNGKKIRKDFETKKEAKKYMRKRFKTYAGHNYCGLAWKVEAYFTF